MGSLFGLSDGGADIPRVKAETPKRTAQPLEQLSEQARRNRRRAASVLTRDWSPPKLSQAGLLGLSDWGLP